MLATLVLAAAWPHVEIEARFDGEGIAGTAAWSYVNGGDAPLEEVHFLLPANAEATPNPHLSNLANAAGHWNAWAPAGTEVRAVRGAPRWSYADAPPTTTTWGLERGLLVVTLAEPLAPGASVRLEIDFRSEVPDRLSDGGRLNGDLLWRFGWFPQPRHREAGGWSAEAHLPAFTHRTTLTADDEDARVVIGGQDAELVPGGARAWSEVPVRSVPVVVSDRMEMVAETIEGVLVRVHYHPDLAFFDTSEGEAREKLRQLRTILPYFNEHYGPYRFRRLEVLEWPTTPLSMAGDGMVLLGDLFWIHDRTWLAWGLYRPIGEVVLAHEVAHQWWGLGLGVAFDHDNWLSEGLSQMLALGYAEERFPSEEGEQGEDLLHVNFFLRWMLANLGSIRLPENTLLHDVLPAYEDHVRFDLEEPLVLPDEQVEHLEESAYRLYQKGYLAARAMRAWLGPEGADEVLRTVYARSAGEMVTVEDLRQAALDVADVDLGPLIDGFVLGTATCDLEVAAVEGTTVQVRRTGDLRIPAVVVARRDGEEERFDFPAGEPLMSYQLPFTPDEVVVDPELLVPDVDRGNNTWPERSEFQFLAPHGDVRGSTWSFNPMPIHRHYLFGISFSGRDANESLWSAGLGTPGFGTLTDPDDPDAPTTPEEGEFLPEGARAWGIGRAYAEAAWLYDRGRAFTLLGAGDFTFEQEVGPVHSGGQLLLGHAWGFYERTDVGTTARLELPRTALSVAAGAAVGQVHEPEAWSQRELEQETGWAPRAQIAVVRDERLNYGFDVTLALDGGLTLAAHDPFGVGALTFGYGFVVPYLGQVGLTVDGRSLTPDGPRSERPYLPLLPVTDPVVGRPFDTAGSAGARLRVPVLRARRVKNLFTLGLLVFNDLFLDLHYGAAVGRTWEGDAPDPVGEVGASVVLGFTEFTGTGFTLASGVGLPTYPSATDLDGLRWFLTVGVGPLGLTESRAIR